MAEKALGHLTDFGYVEPGDADVNHNLGAEELMLAMMGQEELCGAWTVGVDGRAGS